MKKSIEILSKFKLSDLGKIIAKSRLLGWLWHSVPNGEPFIRWFPALIGTPKIFPSKTCLVRTCSWRVNMNMAPVCSAIFGKSKNPLFYSILPVLTVFFMIPNGIFAIFKIRGVVCFSVDSEVLDSVISKVLAILIPNLIILFGVPSPDFLLTRLSYEIDKNWKISTNV